MHWCHSNPEVSRHIGGRPRARWADIFVKFAGERWFTQPCLDFDSWKQRHDEFIHFALPKKYVEKHEVEKMVFDELRQKPPRDISGYSVHMQWEPLTDAYKSIELCGDSMLVVQWLNGVWPCFKDVFSQVVGQKQQKFHQWAVSGCRPRKRHLPWCRHLPRELNSSADSLATRGKGLEELGVVIELFKKPPPGEKFFLRGFWDGGYKPGAVTCGIGMLVEINLHPPEAVKSGWYPCVVAYGKCHGWSAVCAEVQAAAVLVDLVGQLLRNRPLVPPSPPIRIS